ncbi:DUF4232 domain-containing protein [Streptomyces sp. NPDC050560]|uniref:DUF4232 domain-containing protein n=1 Tax=Streptomyces sp. NPDC050560 TaxID=3365630 RepID=UPI00378D9A1D
MTATFNRAARRTAVLLAVVAVGAGAAACDPSSGNASSKGSSQSTAKDSSGGGAAQDDQKGSQGSQDDGKGTKADTANDSSAASDDRCHTGELKFSFHMPHGGRPDMDTTQQQNVGIRLENGGDRTCTLHGFPGVRLVSDSGRTWDLQRSSAEPSTFTLHPGDDTAMVSFTILPVAKDDPDTKAFVPAKILVTPPNETTHVTLDWPYGGALLDQTGATRPGTFVDPIVVG